MGNKVTIAIALYNNEKQIARCIQSVINQTYVDLDILIVNDGSTDRSLQECAPFAIDKRLRIINKENGGLSSTRQIGLDNAVGEYICFIDGDDYLDSQFVELLLARIEETGADVCVCSTRFENENGSLLTNYTDAFTVKNEEDVYTISDIEKKYCSYCDRFLMSDSWNKIYNKAFLLSNKLTFSQVKGFNGTDTLFNHKVLLCSPHVSTITYYGYIHVMYNSSAVHRKNKNLQLAFNEIYKQLSNEAKQKNMEDVFNQLCLTYYLMMLTAFQDVYNENKNNRRQCKKQIVEMRKTHKFFIDDYRIIRVDKKASFSIKLFAFALNCSLPLLFAFLSLREKKASRNAMKE